MAEDCSYTREGRTPAIYTSDVIRYDGKAFVTISLPADPDLNDVLGAIDDFAGKLTPIPSTYDTDHVTIASDIIGVRNSYLTGELLTATFTKILTDLDADLVSLSEKVAYADYTDAHGLLVTAGTPGTVVSIPISASRILGRKAAGNITELTGTEVNDIIQIIDRDVANGVIFPYNTTDGYAVGDGTTADKIIMAILDDATFANNPFIKWLHSVGIAGDHGMSVEGADTKRLFFQLVADKENSYFHAKTEGAGATALDQSVRLSDQVDPADPLTFYYWSLLKDGSDSKAFKLRWHDGPTGVNTTLLKLTTAGLFNLLNGVAINAILDEDNMVSNSAQAVPTQQSTKAYVDNNEVATRTGAGLSVTGSYTPTGTGYIGLATSLYNADELLDDELIRRVDHAGADGTDMHEILCVGTFNYDDHPLTGVYIINSGLIPDNAIVDEVIVDVIVAFLSDDTIPNTTTIGIGVENVGAGTEDIKVAAAVGTNYTISIKASDGVQLDFDRDAKFKTTAARGITINVVNGAGAINGLTAGKMKIYIKYVISE